MLERLKRFFGDEPEPQDPERYVTSKQARSSYDRAMQELNETIELIRNIREEREHEKHHL